MRDREIGTIAVDRAAEENNALFEEARVYIVCALAHRGFLNNHRYKHLRPNVEWESTEARRPNV